MEEKNQVETFRAFFAAPVPDELRQEIECITQQFEPIFYFNRIKWIRPENFHVTFRFLHEVTLAQAEQLTVRVRKEILNFRPFSVRFHSLRLFPTKRTPTVLVVLLYPPSEIDALSFIIDRVAVSIGLPPERRALRPHLTIGRVKQVPFYMPSRRMMMPRVSFTVDKIRLYQSDLTRAGPIHTVVSEIPLLS